MPPKGYKKQKVELETIETIDETETKNVEKNEPVVENDKWVEPIEPPEESAPEFMTIHEAAEHFNTDERAIMLWIEHGHLETIRGGKLGIWGVIPMESIKNCRFNKK